MTSKLPRFRPAIAPILLAGILAGPTPSPAQDPGLPLGRWAVESRGLDWPTRLEAIEIRAAGRPGEATLTAFDRDEHGQIRPWATARVDRRGSGTPSSRWFSATWSSGPTTTRVQIRPDGTDRLLALVRERPGDRGASERVRQVTLTRDGPEGDPGPAIRPEPGSSAAARPDLAGVFVARADGTETRAVARPDGFARAAFPAWSPDGRSLAFAAFDAGGRDPLIRIVAAAGGPTLAIAVGTMPTWSADGSRVAYVATGRAEDATDWAAPGRNDERIESVTLSGARAGEPEILARGIWPRWSPTDGRLAFVGRRDANWDVYVRSADGLGLTRLTDDPSLDTEPTWAANGKSLVFLSDRGNRWDLYRVVADGRGTAERLTNHARREDRPSLHPGGRLVAFVDGRGRPDASIQVLDLDRGTVRPFPATPDGDRDPAWSPDGRSIGFVSRRPGPSIPPAGQRP